MADIEKRVLMAREVARRWLSNQSNPEYRLKVLYGGRDIRNLPNLLRAFRDKKAHFEGVAAIPDMGIQEGFDFLEVWSSDQEALLRLQEWFEKRGCETTGIW